MKDRIDRLTDLDTYASSLVEIGGTTYFMARRGTEKLVGSVGPSEIDGQRVGEIDGKTVIAGPTDHANARAVRTALPWTAPKLTGLAPSVGLGDRLGLATPGHVRALGERRVAAVLAQQSIREMTRTDRTPEEVHRSAA